MIVKSTGDEFDLNWNIKSTENQIELNILPTSVHQEVEMLDVIYWLARCRVTANIKGKSVNGIGYVYIKKRM
jgi:predicted secreted hydrolase